MRLKRTEREFVSLQRVCRVATVGADGRPHNVPVCPLMVADKLYFASEATAVKVRNLERTGQIAIAFDEYTEVWSSLRGVLVWGTVRLIEAGPVFRRVRRLLYQRYPQYEEQAALEEREAVLVEITPTRKFSWSF